MGYVQPSGTGSLVGGPGLGLYRVVLVSVLDPLL